MLTSGQVHASNVRLSIPQRNGCRYKEMCFLKSNDIVFTYQQGLKGHANQTLI